MEAKKIFNKSVLIRIALFIGSLAAIIFCMPRADHQSYNYEVGQPWKYPLLTAEFDLPVLRDSASTGRARDSINNAFIPFVKEIDISVRDREAILQNNLKDSVSSADIQLLVRLFDEVYQKGILEEGLANALNAAKQEKVRMVGDDPTLIETASTADMLSQAEAYGYIDSMYRVAKGNDVLEGMKPFVARTVYELLTPDVEMDTVIDEKFRSEALLEATAAMGVIKQGQRIVDRGEIVTDQICTNLNTYMSMLEETQSDNVAEMYHTVGRGLIVFALLVMFYIFMYIYEKEYFLSNATMSFLIIYITLFVLLSVFMFENVNSGLYLIPFAMIPVVIIVFLSARTAIFSLVVTVLIVSMIATFPHQFIIMEIIAGLCATFCINNLTKRTQIMVGAFVAFVAYCFSYFALTIFRDGNLENFDLWSLGYFLINSVVLSFAYIMIVIVEKIFGFTSNVTLIELNDINHPLLRKLAEDAPGTFQHSMQVATLASAAADKIDANPLLVRTGALYHDIGKIDSPAFFTENQYGIDPHSGLDPEVSAKKIISHVTKGLELAHKKKLPQAIRDFIVQHHGKGITRYFYNTAMNRNNGVGVDIENFRYPGPNPKTKETALLMMADAVEAASRSLKEYSNETISNLVDKIIDGQMADGLYKEAPLTFQDIQTVKQVFKKRLSTLYHTRVVYPELKKSQ